MTSASGPGAAEATVPHDSHGNSVAAWTAVITMMVGFLVMSVAVAATTVWLFVVGAVVVVAGVAAWKVLGAMGLGISGHEH